MSVKTSVANCPPLPTTLQAIQRRKGALDNHDDHDKLCLELMRNHKPDMSEAQISEHLVPFRRRLKHAMDRHCKHKSVNGKTPGLADLFVMGPEALLKQTYLDRIHYSPAMAVESPDLIDDEEDADAPDGLLEQWEGLDGRRPHTDEGAPTLSISGAQQDDIGLRMASSVPTALLNFSTTRTAQPTSSSHAKAFTADEAMRMEPRPAHLQHTRTTRPFPTAPWNRQAGRTIEVIDDSTSESEPFIAIPPKKSIGRSRAHGEQAAQGTSKATREPIHSRTRAPINYGESEDECQAPEPKQKQTTSRSGQQTQQFAPSFPKAFFGEVAGAKSKRRDRGSSEYEDNHEAERAAKRQRTMYLPTTHAKGPAVVAAEVGGKSKRRDRSTSEHEKDDVAEPAAKRQKMSAPLAHTKAYTKETAPVASEASTPDVLSTQYLSLKAAAVQSQRHPGRQMSDSPLSDLNSQLSAPETIAAPFGVPITASSQNASTQTTAVPPEGPIAPPSLDASTQTAGVPLTSPTMPLSLDASTQTISPTPPAVQGQAKQKEAFKQGSRYHAPVDVYNPVDAGFVEKKMEGMERDLFFAVQSYCQLHGIEHMVNSTFVPQPSPQLNKLYVDMFGDERWRTKLADLEASVDNLEFFQIYTLLGLFGAGIRSMVFDSPLPWDIKQEFEASQGPNLDIWKELIAGRYQDTYEGFIRGITEQQIFKDEFQNGPVADHARSLAESLTEILRPHLIQMQKGPSSQDPAKFKHWGEYLEKAFKQAIIVKQVMSVSPFGPFKTGVDSVIGKMLDPELQEPRFEMSGDQPLGVLHGVLPAYLRILDNGVEAWSKATVIPYSMPQTKQPGEKRAVSRGL